MLYHQRQSKWSLGGSHHVTLPASRPFGIKFANPSDTMFAWSVHRLFLFKAFQPLLVIYLHTVGLKTLKLLGLSSKVFTFDYLFVRRSEFFKSLAVSLTEWPEDCKKRCLSCSTNSVGLHFCEIIEKIKENNKKYENRKPSRWAEKYDRKNYAKVHIWGKN